MNLESNGINLVKTRSSRIAENSVKPPHWLEILAKEILATVSMSFKEHSINCTNVKYF